MSQSSVEPLLSVAPATSSGFLSKLPCKPGKASLGILASATISVSCLVSVWSGGLSLPATWLTAMYGSQHKDYTDVQHFGFNIFTAPGTEQDGCFTEAGEELESCYLGSPEVFEDISQRASIMLRAIHNAYASQSVDHRPTTLKIFTAPEFYWRGIHGAYRIRDETPAATRSAMSHIIANLSQPQFKHWVFVLGTFVMATKMEDEPGEPLWEKFHYYNFAPIHIGGTTEYYAEFKYLISGVDFLHYDPLVPKHRIIAGAPGVTSRFCKKHPLSNGCVYGHPGHETMELIGFGNHKPVENSRFEVGGLSIGIEICLDHAVGKLDKALGPSRTVDVQLVVSAGMNIAMGPVCTVLGGPVFLSDGAARTEMTLNEYGHGRISIEMPNGQHRFGLGIAYGADSLVALQQWVGDVLVSYTGQDWGPRSPGEGTLAGGSKVDGETGIPFERISALGPNWQKVVGGYFHTASYEKGLEVYRTLRDAELKLQRQLNEDWVDDIEEPKILPTVDIYGPFHLP